MNLLKYGLTIEDINNVEIKLGKQKKFLEEFKLDLGEGTFNLLDNSMHANINPKKYFAEVNNRVNSLFEYSKMLGLYPVFLTMTLPPEYHPNSKTFKKYTVRESIRELSYRWKKFIDRKIFKHIKKTINHNMIYLRVIEPHKDGCPHCHALIFIPKNFIIPVKKAFIASFSADASRNAHKDAFKYVWSGQEGGAIAYILKYINKTFKHALEDRMTLEAYYYAFHSIRRFTTSQTLLPLYIHRKIRHDEKFRDFIWTTLKYKDGTIYSIYDKKVFLYRYMCEYDGLQESVLYSRSPELDRLFKKASYAVPTTIKRYKSITAPVLINDKLSNYVFEHNRFRITKKPFEKYSNWDLLEYYNNLDVDTCDFNHLIHIRNLCVGRGLVDSEPILKDQIYGFEDYKSLCKYA